MEIAPVSVLITAWFATAKITPKEPALELSPSMVMLAPLVANTLGTCPPPSHKAMPLVALDLPSKVSVPDCALITPWIAKSDLSLFLEPSVTLPLVLMVELPPQPLRVPMTLVLAVPTVSEPLPASSVEVPG